jgi:hypothetical protein
VSPQAPESRRALAYRAWTGTCELSARTHARQRTQHDFVASEDWRAGHHAQTREEVHQVVRKGLACAYLPASEPRPTIQTAWLQALSVQVDGRAQPCVNRHRRQLVHNALMCERVSSWELAPTAWTGLTMPRAGSCAGRFMCRGPLLCSTVGCCTGHCTHPGSNHNRWLDTT